jgi:hypothetical protein
MVVSINRSSCPVFQCLDLPAQDSDDVWKDVRKNGDTEAECVALFGFEVGRVTIRWAVHTFITGQHVPSYKLSPLRLRVGLDLDGTGKE